MQSTLYPEKIEKESIAHLSFKKHIDFEQEPGLVRKLQKATQLGNSYKTKCLIDFHADSGLKSVQTTIWATGKRFICLKGGVWIPIDKIVNVKVV